MPKKLYISHPQFDVWSIDTTSELIDDISRKLTNDTYHTSVGDLSSNDIIKLSNQFDSIFFLDDLFDKSSDIYQETTILLSYLAHRKPILNFKRDEVKLFLDDTRIFSRPDHPVLWVYGCSHSYGVGLSADQKSYGEILSELLNLPLMLIAQPGSSTRWSLRHLINTNFQDGDTVVWQLTTPNRVSRIDNSKIKELFIKDILTPMNSNVFSDDQIYFDQLSILRYGYQYLSKAKVNFVITSILNTQSLFYDYLRDYVKYKEFCYSPKFNVDLGTDKTHFGPQSHNNLACALSDHLIYLYGSPRYNVKIR
jgi:hypothetical protein